MDLSKNLLPDIHAIIAASKEAAIRSVDLHREHMDWNFGQKIFEEEQGTKEQKNKEIRMPTERKFVNS